MEKQELMAALKEGVWDQELEGLFSWNGKALFRKTRNAKMAPPPRFPETL